MLKVYVYYTRVCVRAQGQILSTERTIPYSLLVIRCSIISSASLGPHYVRERFLDVINSVITAISPILCFPPTYDKDISNIHVLRISLNLT